MTAGPDEQRPPSRRPPADDDGPVLPRRSDDDRDETWGDRPGGSERDAEWYRRQRPPHHG